MERVYNKTTGKKEKVPNFKTENKTRIFGGKGKFQYQQYVNKTSESGCTKL